MHLKDEELVTGLAGQDGAPELLAATFARVTTAVSFTRMLSPLGNYFIAPPPPAAMAAAGVLIDCPPLESATTATTVRVRAGETVLTDGPAAELKEQIGGYTLVECADLDEAISWASQIPAAWKDIVEVRPVIDFGAGAN